MEKNENFSGSLKSLIGAIFANSQIPAYVDLSLYVMWNLEMVGLFLGRNWIQGVKFAENRQKFVDFVVWSVFGISLLTLGGILIVFAYENKKRQKKDNQKAVELLNSQSEDFWIRILRRTSAISLILHRRLLTISTLAITLTIIKKTPQQDPLFAISMVSLVLLSIIYIFSHTISFNKLSVSPNATGYPFVVNLESIFSLGLPVGLVVGMVDARAVSLVNGVLVVAGMVVLWVRPIVSYRRGAVSLWGCAMMLGTLVVETGRLVMTGDEIAKLNNEEQTLSMNYILTYFLSIILVGTTLYNLAKTRLKTILLFKPPTSSTSYFHKLIQSLNKLQQDEIFFYHLLNYQSHKQDLILWALKIKKQSIQWTESISKPESIANRADKVIEALKGQAGQVKVKLHELALEVILRKYWTGEVAGGGKVKAFLVHDEHLHYILPQVLLLTPELNVFKCYQRLKYHQKLSEGSMKSKSWFQDVFNSLLIFQLDHSFKLKIRYSQSFSLRAQRYFMFQRGYESLRSEVLGVSELRETFWRESTLKQSDCKQLQALVKKNYAVQQSVYAKTHRLTKLFSQDKSPIVLYRLISSYSKLILNKNISSTLSPYKCLYQKYQKQLEEFEREGWGRLNEGKAGGNFGILERIGVCLVDLEQDTGKIEWGNGGFWGEVYGRFAQIKQNCDDSTQERQSKVNQTLYPNINDFILPDLQILHIQSLKNLSQAASHLYSIHSQATFLFQPHSKLLYPIQLHIQLYPCLFDGLKACCFFTEIPPNDTMSTFSLLMKHQSWQVVGWTEGFSEWRDLLLGEGEGEGQNDSRIDGRRGALGELKQVIEKISAKKEEAQSKDGKKDENQSQTSNIPKTEQNKQKSLKILISDHTFAIILTNLFKQKAQSGPTLFQLQFTHLSQQNDTSSFSNQKTSTVINATEEQIEVNSQSSNITSSLNSRDILRGLGLMRSLQKSDKDFQTINEDTDHVINDNVTHSNQNYARKRKTHTETDITKTYTNFTNTKQTPKTIKTWTIATITTIILLFSAILSNICIFNYRQSQYQKSDQSIKYYNQLITDIGQLIIALRQYNYYAFFRGPQDLHIPLLIKQVDTEEEQVNFKLNQVSKYLNEKWEAMEVDRNNSFKYVLEEDYIVIADFMLSSMTYISEVSPEEMTFPIFWGDHPKGQDLTKTQVNFYDAVYNGIYVVLENLNKRNAGFMNEVLGGINRWETKLYVYPCAAGLLIILIFIIISSKIEKRANSIRQSAVRMLSEVTYRQKNEKLKAIEEFRQINDFQQVKQGQQFKEDAMSYVQKTISTFNIQHRIKRFGDMILCDKSNRITDKTPTGNPQTSRQTKRELTEDCKTIDEVFRFEKTEGVRDDERVFMEFPQKNSSLMFYTIVCAPTVAYLIGMLIGGFTMDDFMAKQLQMGGLIHSKKSNLEQVLILTRRTFYYQSFIGTDPQKWSSKGISFVQDIFWQNRKLQAMIEENQNSHLNKLMQEINYKSLCNYLAEFPRSDYYSVKFSQQQCKQFANGLFLNGMKSSEVLYMESSLNLFTQVKDPSLLTREERYEYIKGPQIKAMKIILAYLEIFMDMMKHAFEKDLMEQMQVFFGKVNVLSGVAMGVVLLLAIGVKLRSNKIRKGRKFSTQIVEMISLRTIKQCSRLRDCWGNIDARFYE